MPTWGFLTNHALVLLCIARDPDVRLRDTAATVGITERSEFGIVSDLVAAGYIIKEKAADGIATTWWPHLPVPESADRQLAIGDLLAPLGGIGCPAPRHRAEAWLKISPFHGASGNTRARGHVYLTRLQ